MARSNRNRLFSVLAVFIAVVLLTSVTVSATQSEKVATTLAIEVGTTSTRVSALRGENRPIHGANGDPQIILTGAGTRSTHGPLESAWTSEGFLLIKNGTDKARYVHPSNTFFNLDLPSALRSWHEHYDRPTIAGYQAFTLLDVTAEYLRELIASAESIMGHNITSLATVLPDGRNIQTRAKDIADDELLSELYPRYNPPSTEETMMAEATFAASRFPHRVTHDSFRKTSAAIFSFDNGMEYSRGVLVYRLGASTFEVSVQRVDGGTYDTLSSIYEPHLGGNKFNRRVLAHLLMAHKNKTGQDLSRDNTSLQWLASEVETAKRVLSVQDRVQIQTKSPSLGRQGFSEQLTRSQFEDLNRDLFDITILLIDQAIEDSAVYTKDDIQDIVFAGGSSNIPFLQSAVRDYFGHHKKYHGADHPENTIVLGAAKIGHWYQDEDHYNGPRCCLGERFSTLGIETAGGVMFKFTDRDSDIDINKMYTFSTTMDNQDRVAIQVFRGDGTRTGQNVFLGGLELAGIAPAPKGVPQIRVRIHSNRCGNSVHLSVMDVASGMINGTVLPTWPWFGEERIKYETLEGGEIVPAGDLSTFLAV